MATERHIKSGSGSENLRKLGSLNCFAKSIFEANPDNLTINTMDITSLEVQAFLKSLHENEVKYILVGGVATAFHGHIRTTQDLNLWVQDVPENKRRLIKTLNDITGVTGAEKFENIEMIPGWSTITIGTKGFVADFMGYMKSFSKEDFDKCYQRARKGNFEGIPITVIHLNDLISEKKAVGRPKDLDDVENLEKIRDRHNKFLYMSFL